jgi:nucleoside-triphosphatase
VGERDLVIIDEIGKMELFSAAFREVVLQVIDSGKRVLGTIMLNPNPWADAIKHRPQVNLLTVNRANRREVLEELSGWLETAQVKF